MEKISRKDMKHDEFVDTSFRLLKVVEDHPRYLMSGVLGLLALVIIISGTIKYMAVQKDKSAEEFAKAQAAVTGLVALDGTPEPENAYQPSFASTEDRTKVALERLQTAADGSGPAADLAAYLKGVTLLESGDVDGAVASLEKSVSALGADPSLGAGVKESYAVALEKAERNEEALEIWMELAGDDSGFPKDLALFGQARVQRVLGQVDEATAALEEIVELYPESPMVQAAKDLL